MIGHASIFVETQNCRILMDPVLWDPFCEGLNETCPKREVIHEKLPPEKYDLESMRQLIDEEISTNLSQFIHEHRESLFLEHRLWNIIYQLEVVFPDGSQKWHIDFSQDPIQVVMGRNPKANLFTYITASGLYSLIQKKRDWDYIL